MSNITASNLTGFVTAAPVVNASIQKGATIVANVIGSGPQGAPGLSSYEIWLAQGNIGTEEVFLSSLNLGFTHDQIVSAAVWDIIHPLNKYPSVTIVDSSGNVVGGDIEYVSTGHIIVSFSSEFSGKAYLN